MIIILIMLIVLDNCSPLCLGVHRNRSAPLPWCFAWCFAIQWESQRLRGYCEYLGATDKRGHAKRFAKDRTDGPALRRRAGPRRSRRSRRAAPTRGTCSGESKPSGSGPSGNGPSWNGPSGSEVSGNEANDNRPRLRPECGGSGGAQLQALVQLGAERELARRIRQRYHLRPPASNAMSGGSPHRHRHSQASAWAIHAHIRARISPSSEWPPPASAQGQCGLSARLV
jgi:hypothetical protein